MGFKGHQQDSTCLFDVIHTFACKHSHSAFSDLFEAKLVSDAVLAADKQRVSD